MVAPIRSRIAAGAALLDRYFGTRENWTGKVDWKTHDQTGPTCIINQLFAGNYQAGLAAIGAPFRRSGDTSQRTGLNHGFSRIRPETSADLTRAWHEFLGITPTPSPTPTPTPSPTPAPSPAQLDPAAEAKRLRSLVGADAVFSGLRNLLDEFDPAAADYDYVIGLLDDRRSQIIADVIDGYADGATQSAVIEAVQSADARLVVLAY